MQNYCSHALTPARASCFLIETFSKKVSYLADGIWIPKYLTYFLDILTGNIGMIPRYI